jgi:Trk K+ transport system NAD-binding subunit
MSDAVAVAAGENDSRTTYERTRAHAARLVLANCEDTVNTNITLTVREVAPHVPIVAIVEEDDSVDILELSGATTVLPLKRRLGEFLANRAVLGDAEAHVIGTWGPLQIAELPARNTPLAGLAVRETRLREQTGLSIVGLWERGRLKTTYPQTAITHDSVLVLAGTEAQLRALARLLPPEAPPGAPPLVIGAGKVGEAAAAALRAKGVPAHVIDRDARALKTVASVAAAVFTGDAADRQLLEQAGIADTPTVLLTTNDDAMNIYLAVYCRRLNPRVRVVSRITHERNVEAIHRAGADFALSYTSLGVEAVMSLLRGHEVLILGEGVELFAVSVPARLVGRRLRETEIGARTGLSVVALKTGDQVTTDLSGDPTLGAGAALVMLGSVEQRRQFADAFEMPEVTRRARWRARLGLAGLGSGL